MDAKETQLHDQVEIDNLFRVASGVLIGHVFECMEGPPTVVYQEPDDAFDDTEIKRVQDELVFIFELPHVYTGKLHPSEALRKAIEMRRENCQNAALVHA